MQNKRFLNVFVLAMLNMAIMSSLRNLTIVAEYGFASIFLYGVAALLFLFPAALVSAELATGWSKIGGIYIWVREAFGPRWGFFAIWMQWVHNVTWYPAILSFVAIMIAYIFNPTLAGSKAFILSVILIGFWLMTFFNFLGLKSSSILSTFGVIIGTILPGIFIIVLGAHWIIDQNPIQISFSYKSFFPDFTNVYNLVFLAGMFLAFGGLEVSAVHANEVKNPQKNYPRAILLSAVLTFFLFIFGSLSIAAVIPHEKLNLLKGVMNAFEFFLQQYNLRFLIPVIASFIIVGGIAELNTWIIGPVRGLYATSKHGDLPPFFQKLNKNKVPTRLLLFQSVIVSLASLVFLMMPTASDSFWILSALTAELYLIMYGFMFAAAIKLRYSHPHVERAYKIPYAHKGMWFVAGLGFITSVLAFFISFIPPGQLKITNIFSYELFLIGGVVIMTAIPLIIYQLKKPAWYSYNQDILKENRKD
ncbi:MAG: amino acid permease [Chlamydiota bacterium]|jgi:putative glutamate/gamma-aminobutyrate antiporter